MTLVNNYPWVSLIMCLEVVEMSGKRDNICDLHGDELLLGEKGRMKDMKNTEMQFQFARGGGFRLPHPTTSGSVMRQNACFQEMRSHFMLHPPQGLFGFTLLFWFSFSRRADLQESTHFSFKNKSGTIIFSSICHPRPR